MSGWKPKLLRWRAELLQAVNDTAAPMALLTGGRVSYMNTAFNRLYGDCIGHGLGDFFQPDSEEQINWLISEARGEADKIVLPLRDDINSELAGAFIMVQVWPIDEEYCLLSLRHEYSLSRLADIDELTRLPNRRKAMMLLDIERARANRSSHFCLTLADIDHFKRINDTYGHDVGDNVLRRIAEVMDGALREGDWVARWGGEEFIIFTPDNDIVTGLQPIERIRKKIESIEFDSPADLRVTMSFGLAFSTSEKKDVRDIIHQADMLLYEAKSNGRNRVEWQNTDTVTWVADNIRSTIAEGQLTAEIVPLYDWDGAAVARQIAPFLRDYDDTQTEKMLAAAARLRQQALVDHVLLQSTNAQLQAAADERPCFFPLRQALLDEHEEAVVRFLKDNPNVCGSIDATMPLTASRAQEVAAIGKPLALLNFDPMQAPSYLLSLPGLSHIVFSRAANIGNMLSLLQGKVKCYAICADDADEEEKTALKQQGFAGWARRHATIG